MLNLPDLYHDRDEWCLTALNSSKFVVRWHINVRCVGLLPDLDGFGSMVGPTRNIARKSEWTPKKAEFFHQPKMLLFFFVETKNGGESKPDVFLRIGRDSSFPLILWKFTTLLFTPLPRYQRSTIPPCLFVCLLAWLFVCLFVCAKIHALYPHHCALQWHCQAYSLLGSSRA